MASIKGTEELQGKEQSMNLAREYGKRGIPLSSGLYETETSNRNLELAKQFAPIKAQSGMQEAQDIKGIDDLIASLMAGNPEQATSAGFNTAQLGQNASQFAQTLLQQQAQTQQDNQYRNNALAQAMEIAKMQNQPRPTSSNLSNQFASLAPGNTIFDLLNKQALYTAPKSYAPSSSSSSSGW